MRYKAVIFDLDGTLLDTISDITDSVNEVLKRHSYKQFSVDEYKYFVGKGVDVLINLVLKADNIPLTQFEQIKAEYYEEYEKRHNFKTKPYNGILELLKILNENEILINILSNKPHSQTIKVVEHYFNHIKIENIYGKKPEFEIKPNPSSVLDIIKKLNLDKKEILYIGDTSTDIETAHNANLDSVGVLWGFRKRKELEDANALFIVENPRDIYQIIIGEKNDIKRK